MNQLRTKLTESLQTGFVDQPTDNLAASFQR